MSRLVICDIIMLIYHVAYNNVYSLILGKRKVNNQWHKLLPYWRKIKPVVNRRKKVIKIRGNNQ